MKLHELKPAEGSRPRKRRLARGIGSGRGKTAGRGHKGQRSRNTINRGFEGGQTPIFRRLPVKKGFRNVNHKVYSIVNLDDLENHFEAGAEVTAAALAERHIIRSEKDEVKVLGFGSLSKKLTVVAHKYSKTAKSAIESAGGEAKTL